MTPLRAPRSPAPRPHVLLLVLALGGLQAACSRGARPADAPQPTANSLQERLEADYKEHPCDLKMGMRLADAYRQAGAAEKAKAVYGDLLTCGEPVSEGVAMNALGQLEEDAGHLTEAIGWFWKSTQVDSPETQSYAWYLLGELVRTTGTIPPEFTTPPTDPTQSALVSPEATPLEAARQAYLKARGKDTVAPEVFRGLGEVEASEDHWPEALELFQIYLAGNPGDLVGWLRAAELAERAGERESARFYLQTVIAKGSQEQREEAQQQLAALDEAPEPEAAPENEANAGDSGAPRG